MTTPPIPTGCPWCHETPSVIWDHTGPINAIRIECENVDVCKVLPSMTVDIYEDGDATKAETIAAWNTRPAAPFPSDLREQVARIVDPFSFKLWQSLHDYCISHGDDEAEAAATADWAHKDGKDKALTKADSILAISPSAVPGGETFQSRVDPWMQACFGPEIAADRLERCDRFIEEAVELVQASDYPRERAHALVDYVYDRPQGDINQEVGGVMVTLAAHCLSHGVDMHQAGETELARIWTKVEQIRAKQAAKPKGSALPVALPAGVRLEGDEIGWLEGRRPKADPAMQYSEAVSCWIVDENARIDRILAVLKEANPHA